jgi:hypothetical protein
MGISGSSPPEEEESLVNDDGSCHSGTFSTVAQVLANSPHIPNRKSTNGKMRTSPLSGGDPTKVAKLSRGIGGCKFFLEHAHRVVQRASSISIAK